MHDLRGMPRHRYLLTSDGYVTATQDPNFRSSVMTQGQAAGYLEPQEYFESRHVEIETDHLGLRNPPSQGRTCQSLVLMGDSYAFGYGTDGRDIWSARLRRYSESAPLSGGIINLGVYGASPSHQIELFRELLAHRALLVCPGFIVVLLFFEGNDATDRSAYEDISGLLRIAKSVSRDYVRASVGFHGYAFVRSKFRPAETKANDFETVFNPDVGPYANYLPYQREINDLNASMGSAVRAVQATHLDRAFVRLSEALRDHLGRGFVFWVPDRSTVYPSGRSHSATSKEDFLKQAVAESVRRAGLSFDDITPEVLEEARNGNMAYWRDDTHLNPLGHSILAAKAWKLANPQGPTVTRSN